MQILNQQEMAEVSGGNIPFLTSMLFSKADYPFYEAVIAGTMLGIACAWPALSFVPAAEVAKASCVMVTEAFLASSAGVILANYLPELNIKEEIAAV